MKKKAKRKQKQCIFLDNSAVISTMDELIRNTNESLLVVDCKYINIFLRNLFSYFSKMKTKVRKTKKNKQQRQLIIVNLELNFEINENEFFLDDLRSQIQTQPIETAVNRS